MSPARAVDQVVIFWIFDSVLVPQYLQIAFSSLPNPILSVISMLTNDTYQRKFEYVIERHLSSENPVATIIWNHMWS